MPPRLRAPFVFTIAVLASRQVGCDTNGVATYNPPFDEGPPRYDDDVEPSDASDTMLATDVGDDSDTAETSANPAECPATDPGLGANHKPCTAGPSVRCSYEDLCPQHPVDQTQNVYACHDDGTGDHWTLVSKDYVPSCPPSEPKTGDPCPCTIHMGFVACNYGLCEDFTRTYAACKGIDTFESEWKVTPIACNPPEVDGGADADADDAMDASDGD